MNFAKSKRLPAVCTDFPFADYNEGEAVRMKIRFVTEGNLHEFAQAGKDPACDLLLFGFNGLGDVDYRSELAGESSRLEEMAVFSRECGCVVVAGCRTDSCGIRRKSAAVAEKGRILGVADRLHAFEDDISAGAHLKVFETAAGKIGLCVAEDIYFPAVCETLALCDADVIVCPFEAAEDSVPRLMLRAGAFVAGVEACLCAENLAMIASRSGDMLFSATRKESVFELALSREYRLATVRTRGLALARRADY